MPRNYIRKSLRATSYTAEDLAIAIQRVVNKELTMYAAAKIYKIPVATLHNRIHKKSGIKSNTLGRPPVLPLEIETQLANGLAVLEKWGFGLSRREVFSLVKEFIHLNGISTPFNSGRLGPDWFANFRKRHKLSLKKAQPIEHVRRKNTDPFIIGEYFNLLQTTLKTLGLEQRPALIWNLDETSVSLDPSKTKVVGLKGAPCSRTTHGTGKEHITVLTAVSAGGQKLTPLIIFKGKYVWDTWMADTRNLELSYAASKRGWMETEIFHNYMEKVFIPGLGEERPVLVVYDGHSTHVDIKVVELARKHNITILKLPPHTSHLLQPLDVAVFKSFKSSWDAKLVEWQRHNVGVKLPKKMFSKLFAEVWNNTKSETIINGFRKTGICPFNSDVISVDKYDPRSYKRWIENHKMENVFQPPQSVLQSDVNSPVSLHELSLNIINRQISDDWTIYDLEDPQSSFLLPETSETVHLLVNVRKDEEQASSFVASNQNDLPICLSSVHRGKHEEQASSFLANHNPQFSFMLPETSQSVHLLVNVRKDEEQASSFVASNQNDLPICLSNIPPKPITSAESKIKIISNEVVNYPFSFEDLLLQKVQQNPRNNNKTQKKRVAIGAEVITDSLIQNKTNTEIETHRLPRKKVKRNNEDTVLKEINANNQKYISGEISKTKKKQVAKKNPDKNNSIKKKKTKSKLITDTDSSNSETDTDSEYENMHDYIEQCSKLQDQENIEPDANMPFGLSDIQYYDETSLQLKEEDWLVVQFTTKKSVKHFIGRILSIDDK
uniref:HTH CENPB-type domain-containing protein n=1 Tax=Heliothis virescens TaxID=7102 RepID=A0A2A4JKM4_HELVI